MDTLALALFLSTVTNRVVEAFVIPLRQKFPALSLWWLIYVSWVLGGALSMLAGVNLFEVAGLTGVSGLVLTGIVVGGGSNLIADLFKTK